MVKSDFGKTVNPPSQISIGVSEKEGGNSEKENGDRCNCACPQKRRYFSCSFNGIIALLTG